MPAATQPHVFESGDRIYLVAPVTPVEINDERRDELAAANPILADLKRKAPNENLMWLQGNYVEADNANANGHEWTANELSIKSLTPMFCPVTVMHDPRTAVGLIADVALRTPEVDKVPRARIESVMAIWAHRFPEVAAEALHNYEAGTLMQSMECQAPYYSCGECGQTFQKLPQGAESKNWCAHLAESANARRILGGVTFTGTGLIFGSRGARGAYSEANLEVAVKEEIVAAHQELHERASKPSQKKRRSVMDIEQEKYDELIARPTRDELKAVADERDKLRDEKAEADRKIEQAETAQKAAETERDTLKAAKEQAEETARAATLGSERLGKLGSAFKGALGEHTTKRLEEQAKDLSDDDWEARLTELEELTAKKRDEGGATTTTATDNGGTVTTEETASANLGGGGGNGGGAPGSSIARSAVIGGLTGKVGKKKAAATS
jgi:Spy/CpxP family protein refolding chaperone